VPRLAVDFLLETVLGAPYTNLYSTFVVEQKLSLYEKVWRKLADRCREKGNKNEDNVLTLAEARANVRKKTTVRCIVCN